MPHTLRILHISDLHATPETPAWSRKLVLGREWTENLEELRNEGDFDLVCFTGDVAYSGKAEDYALAHSTLTQVLKTLGLPPERLFVVPGNHDIDRSLGKAAWEFLRTNKGNISLKDISRWMARKTLPPGELLDQRNQLLSRQSAYRDWIGTTLNRPDLLPQNSPHGTLGYRKTLRLPRLPFDIHVIGLDSSWAAGNHEDKGRLLVTADQARILTTEEGEKLTGFRLALLHHPLEDLADQDKSEVSRCLDANVDLLLRGHLHEPELKMQMQPGRTSVEFAAGCLYENERYRNACHSITVHLDDEGHLLYSELHFRNWEPKAEYWRADGGVYKDAKDGRLVWPPQPARIQDERLPPQVFIGREQELERIAWAVRPEPGHSVRPVSIQGMPGVGKTSLAEHFFERTKAHFPGGLFRMVLDPQASTSTDQLLRNLAELLKLSIGAQGLSERLRMALRSSKILLLIENVDSEDTARLIAPLVFQLGGCPMLLTGRRMKLGADSGWECIDVPLFDEAQALKQLDAEWQNAAQQDLPTLPDRKALAKALGYLPLALHLAASHLRVGGLDVPSFLHELSDQKLKLRPADPADRLLDKTHLESRAVLESTFALSHGLLRRHLGASSERLLPGLEALGHAPPSGFGASLGAKVAGLSERELRQLLQAALLLSLISLVPREKEAKTAWRIHPLLAEFLRNQTGATEGFARLSEWFLDRLPKLESGKEQEQGQLWNELNEETESLIDWLSRVPRGDFVRVVRAGSDYAQHNGPYAGWTALCERTLQEPLGDSVRSNILWTLGQTSWREGSLNRAFEAAKEKLKLDQSLNNEREAALASGLCADIRQARGQFEEALRIRREEELPVFETLGDIHSRAITLGKIADILRARGQFEEALRIRREEELPVFEKLGDVRARAITLGKIADILEARGQLDEALRIRREEGLPVFEKLGDVRARAITLGQIADILQARGQVDDALRIHHEVLPVFEKLGDVRERALTLGKIADILRARGQLDESLRIRREEELPVFEKLGDVRECAITLGKVADILQARGQLDESLRIRREEELPVFEKLGEVRERATTLGKIADILQARGQVDDALRTLNDEVLPIFEKLGDVRSRALTLGKIADILQARGQLDEALRIRCAEELPVYQKLGDVHSCAITLSQIADILQARGQVDDALRTLNEKVLPIFEKLGDGRSRALTFGQIADILQARGQADEALRIRREEELPIFEKLGDDHSRAITLEKIAVILQARGQFDEALRTLHEEVLPVFEKLGNVRSLLVSRINLALVYRKRNQEGDRQQAIDLLLLALEKATELRLPVADRLRGFLQQFGQEAT